MAESAFNKKFRAEMAARGMKIYRVESHSTSPGMPDNHYIIEPRGRSGWMEIKEAKPNELLPNCILYQPKQVPWHIEYTQKGGAVFTLLHVPRMKEVILIEGRYALSASIRLQGTPAQVFSLDHPEVWEELLKAIRVRTP